MFQTKGAEIQKCPFFFLWKVIPDLKQQVSELENQKLDLENRLQEQTAKLKGKVPCKVSLWSPVLQLRVNYG